MKKLLLIIFLLTWTSLALAANIQLKSGIGFLGKFSNLEGKSYESKNNGWEITLEGTEKISKNFEVGIGLSYQNHGKIEKSIKKEYSDKSYENRKIPGYTSLPVYVTAKYNFENTSVIKPYIKIDLGYSFNVSDRKYEYTYYERNLLSPSGYDLKESKELNTEYKNGIYYGIGIGAEYNNFLVELMYKKNKGEIKTETYREKIEYDRIAFSIGYRFNF